MVEKLGHVGISADKSYTTSQLYVATGEDRFPAFLLPLIKSTPQITQDFSIMLHLGFPEMVQQVDFAKWNETNSSIWGKNNMEITIVTAASNNKVMIKRWIVFTIIATDLVHVWVFLLQRSRFRNSLQGLVSLDHWVAYWRFFFSSKNSCCAWEFLNYIFKLSAIMAEYCRK